MSLRVTHTQAHEHLDFMRVDDDVSRQSSLKFTHCDLKLNQINFVSTLKSQSISKLFLNSAIITKSHLGHFLC